MNSHTFWREVRDVRFLATDMPDPVRRISVPPSAGARLVATLSAMDGAALFSDWAGGLIWLQLPVSHDGGAEAVRAAVSVVGGHATLLRAGQDIRAAVPVSIRNRTQLQRSVFASRKVLIQNTFSTPAACIRASERARKMQTNFSLTQLADPAVKESEAYCASACIAASVQQPARLCAAR